MSAPMSFDAKGVLIDKLGENSERFDLSNIYLKNGRGLTAIHEIMKLKAELLDFAKDPNIKKDDEMLIPRPEEPKNDDPHLTESEKMQREENYRKLMREYELAVTAIRMKVPIADKFAIEQYLEPYWTTVYATPAVKGRRFHAFTKNIEEPSGGLFGMRQAKNAAG